MSVLLPHTILGLSGDFKAFPRHFLNYDFPNSSFQLMFSGPPKHYVLKGKSSNCGKKRTFLPLIFQPKHAFFAGKSTGFIGICLFSRRSALLESKFPFSARHMHFFAGKDRFPLKISLGRAPKYRTKGCAIDARNSQLENGSNAAKTSVHAPGLSADEREHPFV